MKQSKSLAKPTIRNIVRAIIHVDDKILVTKDKFHGHFFLPGGGLEQNESISQALHREIFEEMGIDSQIGNLVGVFENFWQREKKVHHEILFLMEAKISSYDYDVVSQQDQIEFSWVSRKQFEDLFFLPHQLKQIVCEFLDNGYLKSIYSLNELSSRNPLMDS